MALVVKEQSFVRELQPEVVYLGRCVQVVDLGTQKNEKFGTEAGQIHIGWELLGQHRTYKDKDGNETVVPVILSKRYTASLGDKATLRADLEKWRGKKFTKEELDGFDVSKLIGVPCQVQVVHVTAKNGNTYANITGILAPMKGIAIPQAETKPLLYDIDKDGDNLPDGLPEFLFNIIKESPEYLKAVENAGGPSSGEGSTEGDGIPF